MCPVYHPHGHVFDIFLVKQNLMTLQTFFVKSILVQKIVLISIYDIIMSPEDYEIKKKDLHPL